MFSQIPFSHRCIFCVVLFGVLSLMTGLRGSSVIRVFSFYRHMQQPLATVSRWFCKCHSNLFSFPGLNCFLAGNIVAVYAYVLGQLPGHIVFSYIALFKSHISEKLREKKNFFPTIWTDVSQRSQPIAHPCAMHYSIEKTCVWR